MATDTFIKVTVVGTIKIKIFFWVAGTLSNVHYVPKSTRNLISLGSLESSDCSYFVEGELPNVEKDNQIVIKSNKIRGNLYVL